MYNKKVLIDSLKKLGSAKAPTQKKDMIIDPMGQWAHPGENTRIPSNNITMDNVPYPVYADPNVGPSRMMYPEQEYNFPGADYVDEYPQMKSGGNKLNHVVVKQSKIPGANKGLFSNQSFRKGQLIGLAHSNGQPVGKIGNMHNHSDQPNMYSVKHGDERYVYAKRDIQPGEELTTNYRLQPELEQPEDFMRKGGSTPKLPNKKNSRAYSRSLDATNRLFAEHPWFKKTKSRKNKIYDPNAKYYQDGGTSYSNLPATYLSALQNFVYPEVIDLPEETDSERYGYDAALGVIKQNPNDPIANMNNPWWREHELFHHLQNQAGAMSTYGLVGQRPNPYVASDEAIGSYYDRRGAEFDIELNKIFEQNPNISEEEAYALAEENLYRNSKSVEGEARDYEGYIETGNSSIFPKRKKGGALPKAQDGIPQEFYQNWYQNRIMSTPEGQKLLDKIRPEALERSRQTVPYIYSDKLKPDDAGYYDTKTQEIILNKFLPEAQIEATKQHEFGHHIQAGNKFYNVLDKPHQFLVEQNIVEPEKISTGNSEWDEKLKENYDYVTQPDEMHARVMTLRRLAGFQPNQVITEKDLKDYFNRVKEAGEALDPDIEDLRGVTKGNQSIVNLLNDMVSVPSNREDLNIAQFGGSKENCPLGFIWNGIECIPNPFETRPSQRAAVYMDEDGTYKMDPVYQQYSQQKFDVAESNKKAQEFNKMYAQSKNYKRLLKEQGYTPEEIEDRINSIMNINDIRYTDEGPSWVGTNEDTGNEFISYNVTDPGDWPGFDQIAAHEWGHVGIDSGANPLKPKEREEFINRINKEQAGVTGNPDDLVHDMEPQENRADLLQLRQQLQEAGVFDSTKRKKFTKKDLDKYRKLMESSERNWDNMWNRMFRLYDDDSIIYFMNNVAKNDSDDNLQVAKQGLELDLSEDEIKKYVDGGYIVEDISVPTLTKAQKGLPVKNLINTAKNFARTSNIGTIGTLNTLAKTLAPVMINPARLAVLGSSIDKVGPFTGSPLNAVPFYGVKMESTPGTAFRKFGDTLDYVKFFEQLNPAHGPLLRMGKNQIMSEGNWAELNEPNEQYPGVFGAQFDTRVPGSDLSFKNIPKRNGVLVTDASGNLKPIIPLSEPGLSFHRRLPFSNRYIPVDMDKLRNNEFDWRTVGGNTQSLLERYGYAAGYAGLLGAMGLSTPQEYLDEYINEPIMKGYNKYIKPGAETIYNTLKPKRYRQTEYGTIEEYSKGGNLPKAQLGLQIPKLPSLSSITPGNILRSAIYKGINPAGYAIKEKIIDFPSETYKNITYNDLRPFRVGHALKFGAPEFLDQFLKIKRISPEVYAKMKDSEKMLLHDEVTRDFLQDMGRRRLDAFAVGLKLPQEYGTLEQVGDNTFRMLNVDYTPDFFSERYTDLQAQALKDEGYYFGNEDPLVTLAKKHYDRTPHPLIQSGVANNFLEQEILEKYGNASRSYIDKALGFPEREFGPWRQIRHVGLSKINPDKTFTHSIWDNDNYGVMGGFRWDIADTPEGMHWQANDRWDLNPWEKRGSSHINPNDTTLKYLNSTYFKPLQKIEALSLVGGKPFNIQNNFLVDPKSFKILKTWQKGGSLPKAQNGKNLITLAKNLSKLKSVNPGVIKLLKTEYKLPSNMLSSINTSLNIGEFLPNLNLNETSKLIGFQPTLSSDVLKKYIDFNPVKITGDMFNVMGGLHGHATSFDQFNKAFRGAGIGNQTEGVYLTTDPKFAYNAGRKSTLGGYWADKDYNFSPYFSEVYTKNPEGFVDLNRPISSDFRRRLQNAKEFDINNMNTFQDIKQFLYNRPNMISQIADQDFSSRLLDAGISGYVTPEYEGLGREIVVFDEGNVIKKNEQLAFKDLDDAIYMSYLKASSKPLNEQTEADKKLIKNFTEFLQTGDKQKLVDLKKLGGEFELGDEVDEATMEELKKLGFTFEEL